jgi:hypothetical protein
MVAGDIQQGWTFVGLNLVQETGVKSWGRLESFRKCVIKERGFWIV